MTPAESTFTRFCRLFGIGSSKRKQPIRRTRLHIEQLESRDCPTSAPVIGSVVFDYANPKTNDYLMAQVQNATDADNDTISFTYAWSVIGSVVNTFTTTSPYYSINLGQSGYGDKGDQPAKKVAPKKTAAKKK